MYDADDGMLHFEVEWTGLTGDFSGAHIHQAVAGENGPVVFSLVPFVEGNEAEGSWEVPDSLVGALMSGGLYVNVHSTTYPGGELRAQIGCEFDDDDGDDGGAGGGKVALRGNFPNPFNPETQIAFELAEAGLVRLTVYNVLGRQVASLVNGPMAAGNHTVIFSGEGLPSGLYLYRLEANGFTDQKKMLLLK